MQNNVGADTFTKPEDPRSSAGYNIFSRLLLLWVDPLFWLGYHRPLEEKDLYTHPRESDSAKLLQRFNRYWRIELDRKNRGSKPRLLLALLKCLWIKIITQGLLVFSEMAVRVMQSVLVGYLANLFADLGTCINSEFNSTNSDQQQSLDQSAYFYAAGISLTAFFIVPIISHSYLVAEKNGMICRVIMTSAIYKKVLSLGQQTVGQLSIGHIVNLASNDVHRLDLAFMYIHGIWLAPLHLGVVTYLIYLEIGWYAFVVTCAICLQVPVQVLLGKLFNYLRLKSAVLTDNRVRIMNEVITGIRVIKMYAWEYAFKKVVTHLRKKESTIILQAVYVRAFVLATIVAFLNVITYVTFTVYTTTGGEINAKKVFTTISLLAFVQLFTLYNFTSTILGLEEARVALIRLQKLLEQEELENHEQVEVQSESAEVTAEHMTVFWTKDGSKIALNNISFNINHKIRENNLLAVVGPVGSGKSTLLQALLNEVQISTGTLNITGKSSYASQEPWIFSATLRENIVFCREFNKERYDQVLKACELSKDIEVLVNGDLTLIGDRGVTLSGGQKARVNLARAVYHDADIYLLDDPLSAVDTVVGKYIFKRCIQGLLKDKLVVLATHQVHFAVLANKILVLKDGKAEAYGSYSNLLSSGFDVEHFMGLYSSNHTKQNEMELTSADTINQMDQKQCSSRPISPMIIVSGTSLGNKIQVNHSKKLLNMSQKQLKGNKLLDVNDVKSTHMDSLSISSVPSIYSLNIPGENYEEFMSYPPEETKQGTLSTIVYFRYFQAGGTITTFFVLCLFILGEIGVVLPEWWLSNWASCDVSNLSSLSLVNSSSTCPLVNSSSLCLLNMSNRLYIYTGLTFVAIVVSIARALGFVYLCVNASRVLHNRMFSAVLRSPVLFFDSNPIGRILNRFSKDIGFLDDLLPYFFFEFFLWFFRSLAAFVTTLLSNFWVILPATLLLCIMLLVRWYYLKTSREIKRLEALARSPLYSHLSATLQGLPVIRALKNQVAALDLFHEFQNQHSKSWYLYLVTSRWLGMRMDMLSAIFITLFTFMSIGLVSFISDAALIGLGLTYVVTLSGMFEYVVRLSAEVENLMVSGERVMGYAKLESEATLENPTHEKPSKNWPDRGCIDACNVSFQYAPDLPIVIHDVSFSINSSEKVGIVGRTGAGKSSLISVLYRLAEFTGHITIDGIDIQTLGLHDLRKKMSIIPQDPVLFSGTVRYNLDPFDEYTDIDLWKSLEQVQLSDIVERMEGQLNGEILEGGMNFSVGERQLVCLARALLRKNKILILDEATANVDPNTDRVIHEIIHEEFADSTVLTIAHRLNTIMDSDRIIVLKDGWVKEFDTPLQLLQKRNSLFSQMVDETGKENSQRLHQMAFNADQRKDRDSAVMLVSVL